MPNQSEETIESTLTDLSAPGRRSILGAMESVAKRLESRPRLILFALIAIYVCVAMTAAFFKPLWHDELITYDLASMPTVGEMLKGIRQIDLNPPVLYLLDYASIRIPGAHLSDHCMSLAARLPSIFGGLVASVGLFTLMRRRVGALYALALVCFYWNTPFFAYVVEDRPYALVSGLIVMLMLAWERAIEVARSFVWVAATCALGLALMGSHFMSGIVLVAFIAATLITGFSRGRLDFPLLISYVLPFAIPVSYFAKINGYQAIVFPMDYQPTWIGLPVEYVLLVGRCALILGVLLAVYMVIGFFPKREAVHSEDNASSAALTTTRAELVLLVGILLQPAMVLIAIMKIHGAFFLRYGLPGCIPIAILTTVFIYTLFRGAKYAALISMLASALVPAVVLGCALADWGVELTKNHAGSFQAPDYHAIEPNLPFVAASGLTYVEMNHREPTDFLDRVYYLTDTDAAIQYAHATLFEHEAEVREMFHYPARVETLRTFSAQHSKFLVLGTENYPEDWLLRKLKADGANVQLVGTFETTYKDKNLYLMTINSKVE